MRPDYEFPDKDGKQSPFDHLGKKIVRIWKVEPKKAAVMETEDREFVLMILRDAMDGMPRGPYSYNYQMKGHVFNESEMALVKQHHPRWVKAWQRISGLKGKDYLPYWYEDQLILTGDHPFKHGWDVQTWLKENKWKETDTKGWYTKRVGQGLVRMYGAGDWGVELVFYAYPTGSMSADWGAYDSPEYKEKYEEFKKATERRLPIKGSTGKDLEAKALEVSQAVKTYRPKPRRRVLTDADKQRIKDFNQAVREDLLGYLNVYEINEWTGELKKGRTTRYLADLTVWGSGGLEAYERYFGWGAERTYGPSGFGKKEVGRLFRKVLDQMLKEGLVEYDKYEKKWWKSKSASRVASRHIEKTAGGTDFDVKMDISDPRKAFEAAKRSAEWESGKGGYSGTIAEKDSFKILSRTPMAMADAAEFVRNKQDNAKEGPAYAIPYGEERELSRKEYTVKVQARNEYEARMKAKEIIKAKGRTRKGATVVVETPYKKTTLVREAGKAKTGWVPDPDQYWIVSEYDNLNSLRSERYGSKKEALAVAKEMLGTQSGIEAGMNKAVYEIKKLGKVTVTAPSTRLAVFEVTGTRIQVVVSSRPQGWWFWGVASS